MFYTDNPNLNTLRFGDVVQGFIGAVPVIENPLNNKSLEGYKYQIKSFIPEYSIVMTHCCSIGRGTLALAPLRKIHHKILMNKLNSERYIDFTELNRKIEVKKIFPKNRWDQYTTDKQKIEYEMQGKIWNYIDFFFYDKHDFFKKYKIELNKEKFLATNFYVVDFKDIYNIECYKIQKKEIAKDILNSKLLELSESTREEFKVKIAMYFSRQAEED